MKESMRMRKPNSIVLNPLFRVILLLIPVAFFLHLNSYQLLFEEPRRALVALEMLIADNWMVPTTNGILYYNKPPLYNWVLIPFFKIFGFSEWVVRLPSILSLFATGLLHYFFSRKYLGEQAALLSSLFYITSADILFFFSLLGEIDLFYALVTYLQAVLIFIFYSRRQFHWMFLVSYLLTAVGVLTKGIPSLFFQAITLLLIVMIHKDYKRLFSYWHLLGIGVFCATAGLYFMRYQTEHEVDRYLARLFTETFSRTGVERGWVQSIIHLWNFPVMLVKISAPWILLLIVQVKTGIKDKVRKNPFLLFSFWFCVANGVLYLLSPGTRERYLYMFLPFIFSILAYTISVSKESLYRRIALFFKILGILLILGVSGLAVFGFTLGKPIPAILCMMIAMTMVAIILRWKPQNTVTAILASVALFLGSRIAFDLVILPTKKGYVTYKKDAAEIVRIIGTSKIYLTGIPERKMDEVKFGGVQLTTYQRNEPAYLAFQTSYYLSAFSGQILKYREVPDIPGYYISEQNFAKELGVRTLYTFNNKEGKTDHWYVLFKVL